MLLQGRDADLVSELRDEAQSVRSCFRDMATKGATIAIAAMCVLYPLALKNPWFGLTAFGIVWTLISIQRLGIHKFSTANRINGYQLHLERLDSGSPIKNVGWEEALRAWRIVQATVFESIYTTPKPTSDNFIMRCKSKWPFSDFSLLFYQKKELKPQNDNEFYWFLQAERAQNAGASYHAGSYMERMFNFLGLLQLFTLPLTCMMICVNPELVRFFSGLTATTILYFTIRMNHNAIKRRREILENEMLSIHSCALMWKAVVIAHLWAWNNKEKIDDKIKGTGKMHYTELLAAIAKCMAENPLSIHWRSEQENSAIQFLKNEKQELYSAFVNSQV